MRAMDGGHAITRFEHLPDVILRDIDSQTEVKTWAFYTKLEATSRALRRVVVRRKLHRVQL